MANYRTLPWRTRLFALLSTPNNYLPQAPSFVLKAVQKTGVHPTVGKVLFGHSEEMAHITHETVTCSPQDVNVRCYYPTLGVDLPVILFFHAGGWVIGNLETHDALCRRIAKQTGRLVIAVDYALAPWTKYPVPVQQAEAVLAWIKERGAAIHANPNKIMVMGDSAGGNLSAVLSLKHRQDIEGQVLIYPVLDATLSRDSVKEHENAPVLTHKVMQFFVDCYARTPADIYEPDFSPLFAEDVSQLPPCLMITGDYDILRDEGFAYVQKLRQAGNEVQHEHYPDIHGFISMPNICGSTEQAMNEIVKFVKAKT